MTTYLLLELLYAKNTLVVNKCITVRGNENRLSTTPRIRFIEGVEV